MKAVFVGLCAVGFASSMANAHYGQRVWVDVDATGKINTLKGPPGDNPGGYAAGQFSPGRVFTRDMGALGDITPGVEDGSSDDDGVNFATAFPGYEATPFPTTNFTGTFKLEIVGEIKYFEPATSTTPGRFVPVSTEFAGASFTPYFSVSDSSTSYSSPSNGSTVQGPTAFTAGGHFHPENILFYPGQQDDPDSFDGVYAMGLRLTEGGLTPSDTFYLVLGKNASLSELQEANTVANATLVPEPTAVSLLVLGGGILLRRRRFTAVTR